MSHYVKGSKRQSGYNRKIPYHYKLPTLTMREARRLFTETAFRQGRDKFGTAKIVNKKGEEKTIPASAVPIKETMEQLRIVKPKLVIPALEPTPPQRLRKIAEILAQVGT